VANITHFRFQRIKSSTPPKKKKKKKKKKRHTTTMNGLFREKERGDRGLRAVDLFALGIRLIEDSSIGRQP
jgi:hypothetical protein